MYPSHPPPDPSCLSRLLFPSFLAQVNQQFEPLLSVLQVCVLLKHIKSTTESKTYLSNQEYIVDFHQTIKNSS
jgi:hypothetical protein